MKSSILHDLNLVLSYASEVILLQNGKLFDNGSSTGVLSPQNIETAFRLATQLHRLPGAELLWIKPNF